METAAAPLQGVRVLELARVLAGPWAGQLLADLGADVIKVERPEVGDDTRAWGPPFVTGGDGEMIGSAYYHSCNRGKRSVAIDIASEAGQASVRALAANADVVIENFKVGALDRYGLGATQLRASNPGLIYCSITGFGQNGPYAHRAGYDFIVQGLSGMMSITGEPDGPPQKGGVAYADILTGLYSVVAILAALQRRGVSGQGAHIDMALMDTMIGVLGNQAMNWMISGVPPRRMGNGHVNLVPYQSFKTRDGDLIIAVGNDQQFRRLCGVLGCDALAADPRFATNAARVENRAETIAILARAIADRGRDELAAALEREGVPAGEINAIDEAFADPQVQARGMRIETHEHAGPLPGLASPIVIDGVRAAVASAAPRLGAHERQTWLERK